MSAGLFTVTRNITLAECPWLDAPIAKGTRVFEYSGCTYGALGHGAAYSLHSGARPFFELPADALTPARGETTV